MLVTACAAGVAFSGAPAGAEVSGSSDAQGPGVKIVGGDTTTIAQWPWTIALYRHVGGGSFAFSCGGSLVAPTVVLTAAHCAAGEPPSDLLVVPGITNLSDASGNQIAVTNITIDPSYNLGVALAHDVAILDLASPSSQTTIDVAAPDQAALWATDVDATVLGWGATSQGGPISNTLREVTVPIVSDAVCTGDYGGSFDATTMVCAGDQSLGGKDSCQGDSGGPMVVDDGQSGWRLAGTVSWGQGCAQPGFPGVYARVGEYGAGTIGTWIADQLAIRKNGPPPGGPMPPSPILAPPPATAPPAVPAACTASKKRVTKRKRRVRRARKKWRNATTVKSRRRNGRRLKKKKRALKRAKRAVGRNCLAR